MIAWMLLLACPAAPITPVEGTWTVASATVTEDSCSAASSQVTPASYDLALTGEDSGSVTFALTPDTGDALECVLTTPEFECAPTQETDSGSAGGGSYKVTFTWTTSGTFTSETAAEGAIDMLIVCWDDDDAFCGKIEEQQEIAFPCTMKTVLALGAG